MKTSFTIQELSEIEALEIRGGGTGVNTFGKCSFGECAHAVCSHDECTHVTCSHTKCSTTVVTPHFTEGCGSLNP